MPDVCLPPAQSVALGTTALLWERRQDQCPYNRKSFREVRGTLLRRNKISLSIGALLALSSAGVMVGQFVVTDPGVRNGSVDSGQPLWIRWRRRLAQRTSFTGRPKPFSGSGIGRGGANNGLGPRFNSNQCSSCHSQPAIGGAARARHIFPIVGPNPETLVANLNVQRKIPLPPFITIDGPAREARFKFFLNRDGSLNTTVRMAASTTCSSFPDGADAGTCSIKQPDFGQQPAR